MKISLIRCLIIVSAFSLVLICSVSFVSAGSFARYNETTYTGSLCGDCCQSHDASGEYLTDDWADEIESHGYTRHDADEWNFDRTWIADYHLKWWGVDDEHTELRDIVLISGHGGIDGSGDDSVWHFSHNEKYLNSCKVWPSDSMRLGDDTGDTLEILHVQACDSMTVDDSTHAHTWRPVFGGIHQIMGFHGTSYGGSHIKGHYYNLARDGFSSAVALEWVNELYDSNGYLGTWDNCPVAYTGRNSEAAAMAILTNEQYDTRWQYSSIEDPTVFRRIYIGGCLPNGANEM